MKLVTTESFLDLWEVKLLIFFGCWPQDQTWPYTLAVFPASLFSLLVLNVPWKPCFKDWCSIRSTHLRWQQLAAALWVLLRTHEESRPLQLGMEPRTAGLCISYLSCWCFCIPWLMLRNGKKKSSSSQDICDWQLLLGPGHVGFIGKWNASDRERL